MTKKIRIENADNSNHPVRVTVQDKDANGEWHTNSTVQLDFPTAMNEQYIHSTRRIVIEERAADTPAQPAA